jgi:hypothetical protein
MYKIAMPYSLNNFQIFFSGLFIRAVLYTSQVQASVAWNSITYTDSAKLEHIQKEFESVGFYRFFPHDTSALEKLSLHPLSLRRHLLDALFFIQVYRGLKSCSFLLENASLRIPTSHVRDFSTFSVCPSKNHCPSAQCTYAANMVGRDLDVFAVGAIFLNHILQACTKIFK